ncbi:MAG: sugar phosphate isomerase/epimerase [Chloroflexi bacterium]|nr:sugar phosphate isomerase/epimerase [Chloroflexota bacterium]
MWDVGMMVWRIGQLLDLAEQVEWVRASGFEALSFHASPGVPGVWRGVHPQALDSPQRRALRQQLAGFSRREVHAPFAMALSPADPLATVEALAPIVAFAGEVDASIVTVHAAAPDAEAEMGDWHRALDGLDALACQAGVTVGLENLPETPWFQGPRLPHVGVTLDIGHWCSAQLAGLEPAGSLEAAILCLGDALVHVHAHDHDGTHDHVEVGTGQLDWGSLIRGLRGISYDGFLCLELNPDLVSPEGMRRSLDALRRAASESAPTK